MHQGEIERMHTAIKDAFSRVKEEMDDHRDSINDNALELHHMFDFLTEINEKMEKLRCRLDEMQLALERQNIIKGPSMPILSPKERELLLFLYTNEERRLKLQQLAKRLQTSVSMLKLHVQNIRAKGIPLIEETLDESTYLGLDSSFRDKQARFNVLGISEEYVASMH